MTGESRAIVWNARSLYLKGVLTPPLKPVTGFYIWNWNPDILASGNIVFRWNTLMLIVAFLAARQLMLYLYKKDTPSTQVANLPVYLVLAGLMGARLGHILFYEPSALLSEALTIIFPFETKPAFHVLGRSAFSIHGAILGVLAFASLYHRKQLSRQPYLRLLDRVSLAACLGGFFVFLGSFLNSEIAGKPTTSPTGTVFIEPVVRGLKKVPCCVMRTPDGKNPLADVAAEKDPAATGAGQSRKPVILYLFFGQGPSERLVNEFLVGDIKKYLYDMSAFVYEPGTQPLRYRIFLDKDQQYIARISTLGIARYPLQIFQALACAVLFIYFFRLYTDKRATIPPGRIFGWIFGAFWILEVSFWFMREEQHVVAVVLNLIFALAGTVTAIISYRKDVSVRAAPKVTK